MLTLLTGAIWRKRKKKGGRKKRGYMAGEGEKEERSKNNLNVYTQKMRK
jgi:hypothetical protein